MSYRKKYEDLPLEQRGIIFELAKEFGFEHYSTIDDIDYKFWEDVEPQDIAFALTEQVVSLKKENEKLRFMVDNGLGPEDMENDITYPVD